MYGHHSGSAKIKGSTKWLEFSAILPIEPCNGKESATLSDVTANCPHLKTYTDIIQNMQKKR